MINDTIMNEENLGLKETLSYFTLEFKLFLTKDRYNNLYFFILEFILLYLYDHNSIILGIIQYIK